MFIQCTPMLPIPIYMNNSYVRQVFLHNMVDTCQPSDIMRSSVIYITQHYAITLLLMTINEE